MSESSNGALSALEITATPSESWQTIRELTTSTYRPPKVTVSTSESYIDACARSSSRATTDDPLNLLFQAEKLPPLVDEPPLADTTARQSSSIIRKRLAHYPLSEIQQMIYVSCLTRLRHKMTVGAFIAEAADFNAVTCWEPLYAAAPNEVVSDVAIAPSDPTYAAGAIEASPIKYHGVPLRQVAKQKPIFTDFIVKTEAAKRKHLYPVLWKNLLSSSSNSLKNSMQQTSNTQDGNSKHLLYWHLCVTSRDPSSPPVKGAVRAIIEPFVKKFVDEDDVAAVWLEAGSPRARDVYGWFGFRVVEEVVVGASEEEMGVSTWCMIYTKE